MPIVNAENPDGDYKKNEGLGHTVIVLYSTGHEDDRDVRARGIVSKSLLYAWEMRLDWLFGTYGVLG